jgi:hypothetical protein
MNSTSYYNTFNVSHLIFTAERLRDMKLFVWSHTASHRGVWVQPYHLARPQGSALSLVAVPKTWLWVWNGVREQHCSNLIPGQFWFT